MGVAEGPRSPAESLAAMKLADPELAIELVVAEPDVVSPVAIAWDAAGRMYVAEMRDYPHSPGMKCRGYAKYPALLRRRSSPSDLGQNQSVPPIQVSLHDP
jgi:hypothetical protein